ncbi:UPF0235 protein C15orf40 homolog isoform X2 [Manis pentadactyla]|uniref:UPF0235 protein C15orf40 homolog isoform X2 n=1 Tax=Manis pentadactyla TaxID=143292 RepID=UPI00255CDC12|nr:UPF0235 protein C15orf40 homolog isoform X2 [Manis pentadactyla]
MLRLGRGQAALGRVWGAEMPRKAGATDKGKRRSGGPERPLPPVGPVAVDPKGCVTIAIHAKPGSKQNAVTDLTAEAVSVAIAAPPSEGEANAELCRYLSKVLVLRKSDVVLDKSSDLVVLESPKTLQRRKDVEAVFGMCESLSEVVSALLKYPK